MQKQHTAEWQLLALPSALCAGRWPASQSPLTKRWRGQQRHPQHWAKAQCPPLDFPSDIYIVQLSTSFLKVILEIPPGKKRIRKLSTRNLKLFSFHIKLFLMSFGHLNRCRNVLTPPRTWPLTLQGPDPRSPLASFPGTCSTARPRRVPGPRSPTTGSITFSLQSALPSSMPLLPGTLRLPVVSLTTVQWWPCLHALATRPPLSPNSTRSSCHSSSPSSLWPWELALNWFHLVVSVGPGVVLSQNRHLISIRGTNGSNLEVKTEQPVLLTWLCF